MIDQTPLYFLSDHVKFFLSMMGLVVGIVIVFILAVTDEGEPNE